VKNLETAATRRIIRFDTSSYAPLLALAALIVVSILISPFFFHLGNLLNILRQVSYTGVIALGMTFVIISGGIDLSVGSMTALCGGLAIITMNAAGGDTRSIVLAIAASVAAGMVFGILNGFFITRFRLAPFIVTLGTMSIFRSLTLYFASGGEYRSQSTVYQSIGSSYFLGVPVPAWLFIALAFLFHVLLNHTPYGRYVSAVGSSERVARYSSINVRRVKFITYLLTGLTVGVTAVMMSSRMNSVSSGNAGNAFELDAIAAVVIGGTSMSGGSGTILGTVIGALILGVINNMLNMMGVSPYLQGMVKGLVIILAVLMQYRRSREN
jgi:ribose transport system permease protein